MTAAKEKTPPAAAPLAVIVLAAGKGTRMVSRYPKVLHAIAGRSMLGHVLAACEALAPERVVVVAGNDMTEIATEAECHHPGAIVAIQEQQRGTADAVLAAQNALDGFIGDVLILCGDAPLVTAGTLQKLREAQQKQCTHITVLGMRLADPAGYGRLVTQANGTLARIVEEKDATDEERTITFCNSGIIFVSGAPIFPLLSQVKPRNASGEYYLTDIAAIATAEGLRCGTAEADAAELAGVNSRVQLAAAEALMQQRLRARAMQQGTTLQAPETVFFSYDTVLGSDVTIEPHVVFGPGTVVGDGVTIRAYSHISGAHVGTGAIIGPFARLRPGAHLAEEVHIGNFVEIKNSKLERGVKVNHLSYIGDARVGELANIGAGTITCNYDGFNKFHTDIGAGVFVGSHSALVAPVSIGDGAIIGAGSTITENVGSHALAIARGEQVQKDNWALQFREKKKKKL